MIKLFLTFFKIGLFTFGGGYSMIPLINEEAQVFGISSLELTNFIAISESTPGPFAINIATFIGYNTYGIFGAICATLGVVLPSFIIMLIRDDQKSLADVFAKTKVIDIKGEF